MSAPWRRLLGALLEFLWGGLDFRPGDESRNNAVMGVVALGEGGHNNHHAFPASARHGLKWWQFAHSVRERGHQPNRRLREQGSRPTVAGLRLTFAPL